MEVEKLSRRRRNEREKENNKKVKKKSKVLRKVLLTLLLILIILAVFITYKIQRNGGGLQGLLLTLTGNDEETLKNLDPIQVLVMGVSTDNGGKLTDTIILGTYDPKTQQSSLLSIPRDTFVGKSESSASAYDKINSLYQKSPQKTLEAVNQITGLDTKYYVVVDNQALIKLVDVIGGVDFYVPTDMVYTDTSQDLYINLKEGMQKIDGNKAEQLLRYRHGDEDKNGKYIGGYSAEWGKDDIGRMRTQRTFIMETVKQTIKAKNILKIKDIIDIAYKYVETNIPIEVMKDYVPYAVNIDIEAMRSEYLPGTSVRLGAQQLWFYEVNKKEVSALIQDLYYSNEEENSTESGNGENTTTGEEPKEDSTETVELDKAETSNIKIEILNGSGSEKLAAKAKKDLVARGYNIIKTNNTTATTKTTIINKTDINSKFEQDIKSILGIGNISTSSVSSSKVDVTIIIGKDYK
jgi:polyisoprenyl-teichoic acid--peptidoglycan teichoic acid transferase